MSLKSGQKLGSYRFVRLLGRGGMGEVWEAWEERLERRVAVKLLHAHLLDEGGGADWLMREARLAARVEHPNVVRIYRVEEIEGQLAIEMQFVEGSGLDQLLRVRRLRPREGAELLRQLLEALEACHAQGVLHCDIKPRNILVTRRGHVYLTDFGIARSLMHANSTLSGTLWGTPRYSPPEAWEGARPSAQWDLYSAGMVVYEALCEDPVFDAGTPQLLMRRKLEEELVPIVEQCRELSEELGLVLDRLVAREPARRPAGAHEALEKLLGAPEMAAREEATQQLGLVQAGLQSDDETPPSPSPYPSPPRAAAKEAQGRALRVAGSLAGGMLLVLAAVFYWNKPVGAPAQIVEGGAVAAAGASERKVIHRLQVVPGAVPLPAAFPKELAQQLEAAGKPGYTGLAFFDYDDGIHGRELWQVDVLSGQMELAGDLSPGYASSNPTRFLLRNRDLFFAATTAEHGQELWIAGQNQLPPRLVKDVAPGPMSSEPWAITIFGASVYFYATTLADGREPWVTNGKANQTSLLAQLAPAHGDSYPGDPVILADADGAYVIAIGGPEMQNALWRYEQATHTVRMLTPFEPETDLIAALPEGLIVSQRHPSLGVELWMYRTSTAKLELLLDIAPGADSSSPTQFFRWRDQVLFQAWTAEHGRELWSTDGTAAGTRLLLDINPGTEDGDPHHFVADEDFLYFRARRAEHGQELWLSDGTAGGTRMAGDIRPGPESSTPYGLLTHAGAVYFTADDGIHGEELWRFDPRGEHAGAKLVADILPGPAGGEPHQLQWWNADHGMLVCLDERGNHRLALVEMAGGVAELQMLQMPGEAEAAQE